MQNPTTLLPLPEDLPDFAKAMEHLGRIPLVLYECLEKAAAKVASFREFECPAERMDDGLAASLLRFYAIGFLKAMGIEAQVEEEWTLDWLPFMGISFHYDGYHVRILKGSGGMLPGCGTSEKKKQFYGQVATMYLIGNTAARSSANLLVLWDFDSAYGLSGLWLALPAVGGSRAGDVSAFWCEPIQHPVEGIKGILPAPVPPEDDLAGLVVALEEKEDASRVNER